MSDTKIVSSPSKPRRRWLRAVAWSLGVLVVLLVAVYLVATSSAFFKGVILPRVGAALNADITVGDASVHPFSGISLRDLKVQCGDQKPVVTASEVRARFHLFDLLGGKMHVDEIALVSPTVMLVENPDGSSNLGPLLKALEAKPAAAPATKPAAAGVSKPLQIDLGILTLSNATFLQIKNYADGRADSAGLTNVNVTLTHLQNGQTAQLQFSAELQIENQSTNANGRLAAALAGNFNCAFDADMKPGAVSGGAQFSVSNAGGAFENLNQFSTALDCDVTPTEIKQLALRFQQGGTPLGELAVSGPFDAEKMEGRLDVAVRGVDRRLLNLAGAKSGLDFGTTEINSTNEVSLTQAGGVIAVTGRFDANKVQLTRAGQTTPRLDLSAAYDLTVDRTARTATLRSLNLAGTQNAAPLLGAELTSPMSLAWGGGAGGVGDAAFNLTVTGLNLADWRPFLGGLATAGNAGLKLKVSSHQAGKQIAFELNTDVTGLTARLGSNTISQAGLTLTARGEAVEFKQITLDNYQLQVALQNQPALTASGAGSYDLATGDADAQVKLTAEPARLLQAFPQPSVSVSSGEVELNAQVAQKQKTQTLAGDLTLTNFTARAGKNEFVDYGSRLKLDVVHSPEQIQINQLAGNFSQNGNFGGDFSVAGTYRPAQESGDGSLKFSGLNETALRPFLEPLLAGRKLVSVSVNGSVSGQYDPQAGSAVKADVQVANLVVNDPKRQFPATPLAVGVRVDASLKGQAADVRLFQVRLTPTARATNQINFNGQVDFSRTNAIQGRLKLAADSLDLTGYYDLFTGGTNAVAKAAPANTATAAPGSAAPPEPAAVKLPLQNFTLAVDIGRLYLHEMAVSNLTTTVMIDESHVVVKPLQLNVNGGPVTGMADVDLSVPGYKYTVGFNAQQVPVAPLVDTFEPARAGQMGGTLTADAQITGAGVTGASLQKNLAGKFDLSLTNLNLSVVNIHSSLLKGVINVIATIPELLSSPGSGLVSLLGGVTGRSGLMNDLQQAPIQTISVQTTAGNGQVRLAAATVQSSAFKADATGAITLAAVLTNSTINIPVTVSLSQAIAKQLNMASSTSSGGSAYVPLPQFLTMTGTLGNPNKNINKLALAGVVIHSISGSLLNSNTLAPVGNLLNQLFTRPK